MICGALFVRPEREKVHTVVEHYSGCNNGPHIEGAAMQTKFKDNGRKLLWGFLAILAMSQLYVVRELLAAFSIFIAAFAMIALAVAGLYMIPDCWDFAVARIANIRRPLINLPSVSHEGQKAA
jgi:hypothetical protein